MEKIKAQVMILGPNGLLLNPKRNYYGSDGNWYEKLPFPKEVVGTYPAVDSRSIFDSYDEAVDFARKIAEVYPGSIYHVLYTATVLQSQVAPVTTLRFEHV
jgi:hypothetical protein